MDNHRITVTSSISGIVTDAVSSAPIDQALVEIDGTEISALTNVNGEYSLIELAAGTYTIKASKPGFQDKTISDMELGDDEDMNLDIQLDPEP